MIQGKKVTARSRCASAYRPDSRIVLAFAMALSILLFGATQARAATCLDHIVAAEKEFGIPSGLMLAVSLVESGQGGAPADHILNVGGRAIHAKSPKEASRYLRDAQGRLRSDVFAGCMQLSLAHHKAGFRPVETIVEPKSNVRYAARYLVRLRQESGSWAGALARYNGSSGAKALSYQCKVHRQMAALGTETTGLIDSRRCADRETPSVSPKTRRAFEKATTTPVG